MTSRLLKRIAADMDEDKIISGCSDSFCTAYTDKIKKTVADKVADKINNSSLAETSMIDLNNIIDETIMEYTSQNLYNTIKQFCEQNGISELSTDSESKVVDKIKEDMFNK